MAYPNALAQKAQKMKLLQENLARLANGQGNPPPMESPTEPSVEPTEISFARPSSPSPVAIAPVPQLPEAPIPAPVVVPTVAPSSSVEDASIYLQQLADLRQEMERGFASRDNAYAAAQAKLQATAQEAETLRRQAARADIKNVSATKLREFFSEEEIEAFGESECRVMLRTALQLNLDQKEAAEAALTTQMTQYKEQMDTQIAQAQKLAERFFFSSVTAAIPNWRAINADLNWRRWLTDIDPNSRIQRQVLLDTHRAALDADAVITMFNSYLATKEPAPRANSRVLPTGRAPLAPPPTSTGGEIITRDWIKQQTALYTQGKLSREQWAAIQNTIRTAAAERRVQ